jgi:hypothetical protein
VLTRPVRIGLLVALAAGCGAPDVHVVTSSPAGAYEAGLAPFADRLAVAWYDTRDGHAEIYQRFVSADGTPEGPERRLTAGIDDAYEADIQALDDAGVGGGFVVAWYERSADGRLRPRLAAWGKDGGERWVRTLAESGRNAVVRAAGDRIFAAWIGDEDGDRAGVWAGWWSANDGAELAAPRRLADAGKTTWNLNAAIDAHTAREDPRAWVVFDAVAGTKAEELFLVEAGSDPRVTRLTPDDGFASKYPDLGFSGDRMSVAWLDLRDGNEEVYLSVAPRAWLTRGGDRPGTRVTATPGHSIGAYLAWNGDRLGLAWSDDSTGQHEIYFQDFDRDGRARSGARRLTRTGAASLIPAIRPWGPGFALAWNDYEGEAPATGDEHRRNGPGGGHGRDGRSQVYVALVQ